ncbi:MAG: hypothetical protein AMXMBFR83_11410 [Phycisphaerae bacterium]
MNIRRWPGPSSLMMIPLLHAAPAPAAPDDAPRIVVRFEECPIIVQLKSGPLMGVYQRWFEKRPELAARDSRDGGTTWSEPRRLLELPREPGGWLGAYALVDGDGRLHVFSLNDAHTGIVQTGEDDRPRVGRTGERRLDIWYTRSSDEGKSWTPIRSIWTGYTGAMNSAAQLRSGRLLFPFSCLTQRTWSSRGTGLDAFTFTGQYDCAVLYSDDAGASWSLSPDRVRVVVPDIVSAYGAVEPVVLELKDGRVWMLIRTQLGRFYESFSPDGRSWSAPRPTRIISSDSPPGLLRLADGRMAMFWNGCLRFPYAYGGRHVLHAAVSEDEGRTWRGAREVARDPYRNDPPPPSGDHGPSYPYPSVSKEGMILFTTGVATGAGRSVCRLAPRWLYETRQQADFVNRLDEWSRFGTRGVEVTAHPDRPEARVLALRKPDPDWPSAVVWNFPIGAKGTLRMRVLLRADSPGALLGLTDHFSVPFDAEDVFNNVYNLSLNVGKNGEEGVALQPDRWHALVLDWDTARRVCRVRVDGSPAGELTGLRESAGVNYVRLKLAAAERDGGGMMLESVEADVSASWPERASAK